MADVSKSRDRKDVEDAVRWALAEGKALEIAGRGTKRALGRPGQSDMTLDLSGLTGVTLYEPEELVLSAQAGTPLAEIEALLADTDQQLDFEPMDLGPLLGAPAHEGTLGGTLAANLSGPRRIKAGAARDHFLGFTAVSGRGETFKSGGRVVKNVTGYDLSKLIAGSWGTLAAMTDVTIKVLPRAETESTVILRGLDDAAAVGALNRGMGSAGEASAAAHLPASAVSRCGLEFLAGEAVTALRLEGIAPSIAHRKTILQDVLKSYGEIGALAETESRAFWRAVRDVLPFAAVAGGPDAQRPLWRISTAPMKGPTVVRRIAGQADATFLYDWAGGLVWAELAPSDDAGAALVRAAVAEAGGHATLIRAPAAIRAAVAVFDPQEQGVALLSRRIKESFDPKGVLNPGRMWAGV
jgi:glycolate oxidase FAD binding subunit